MSEPALSQTATQATAIDGSHDFDFLFGHWNVLNRRLRHPLSGSSEWYEFQSTSTETPILGGMGNLEQFEAPDTPNGAINAVAVRLYEKKTGQWSIYWSTVGIGTFGVPTVGKFEDGVGTFFDHEDYNGRPIIVRFKWTHEGTSRCRWEQAFSTDRGASWEPNWIMEFTRSGDAS